jgi:hypothetical protein
MRERHLGCGAWARRQDDGARLLERLVHRRGDSLGRRLPRVEVGGVRKRYDRAAVAFDPAHGDAIAAQPIAKRRGQCGRRRRKAALPQHAGLQAQKVRGARRRSARTGFGSHGPHAGSLRARTLPAGRPAIA